MSVQKSILLKITHTYKHTHQLLIRPPDCFVFVLRQAVPPALASYCWITGINYYAQLYFLYFKKKVCMCTLFILCMYMCTHINITESTRCIVSPSL